MSALHSQIRNIQNDMHKINETEEALPLKAAQDVRSRTWRRPQHR